jgi:hypothetical protein
MPSEMSRLGALLLAPEERQAEGFWAQLDDRLRMAESARGPNRRRWVSWMAAHRRAAWTAGSTVLTVVLAFGAYHAVHGGGTKPTAGSTPIFHGRSIVPPFSIDRPLPAFARRVSLDEASRGFAVDIPLPPASLVGAQTPAVWATADFSVVALSYHDLRVVVQYQFPVQYSDPEANYRGYVKDSPPGMASVGEIGGRPALVIVPKDGQPGSVEFVRDRIRIAVIGFAPTDDLRSIAESVAAAP